MKYLKYILTAALIFCWGSLVLLNAQKHYPGGDKLTRGNRLISVKSEAGKILYQPDRLFYEHKITADGEMSEPEWLDALVVKPFRDSKGERDQAAVRVLYDKENIYLYWTVLEKDGITADLEEDDGLITGDDYVRIDLKPWLPDTITHGREYYYTIAVNPNGKVWDAYFDPYLDGFFFSSWNSNAELVAIRDNQSWSAEMIIPYSGLDLYSDPGWKWNLEFYHGSSLAPDQSNISTSNIGVTVEQGIMVRRPGLVSYYWPRPDFMQEIKPDMSASQDRILQTRHLASEPMVNSRPDEGVWESAPIAEIGYEDRMGEVLTSGRARARIGMTADSFCLNLEADGAKIAPKGNSATDLGAGMAAQMSG